MGYEEFAGNICIWVNDEVVHGIGSQRRIQYGDLVKLDIGVILNGFVGDTAATVPIGEVSEEEPQLLEVTENALYSGIEKARKGRRLSAVLAAIQDEVERNRVNEVRKVLAHGQG